MKSGKRTKTKRAAWRNRIILVVLFLVSVGGAAAWYFFWGPGSTQAWSSTGQEAPTYTFAVMRGDLSVSAAGSGKLIAYKSVDLSFPTAGTLTTLNVNVGDRVEEGQVLASLGSSDILEANFSAANLKVLTAQQTLTNLQKSAGLALAQAYSDLVAAQGAYDSALEDSRRLAYVRCGQDVTIRLTEALERASKQLTNIHTETVGSDVYIASKKAYDTAVANYNQCAYYTEDEENSVQSALEVAAASLQEAQDTYDTLKVASGIDPDKLAMAEANIKVAQTQLSKAENDLAGSTLISPINGKVTYLAAATGDMVGAAKFITIVDVSQSILEVSVNESDLNRLEIDSAIEVNFDALPNMTFVGKVIQVYPEIARSGQYRIARGLAELDSEAVKTVSNLPLGLSATVTVVKEEAKDTLLVPEIAVKDMGDGTYVVMVKDGEGQLKRRTVTTGIQDNDYIEIVSGLAEGDLVSTGTVNFIAAGSSTSSDSLKNAQNDSGGGPGGPPPMP